VQQFTTDSVQQRSRFDYWSELVSRQFAALDFTRSECGVFFGSLATHQLGLHHLLLVKSTSQRITRTLRSDAGANANFYALNYLVDGHARVTQNDNCYAIGAGDFFLFDLTAAGALELTGEFNMLTLSLPRPLVDRYMAQAQRLCAIPVSTHQSGPACVSIDMLQSLARNCPHMTAADAQPLIEGLVRVIAAALGSLSPSAVSPATANSIVLTRIRNYILSHLDEEDLSPCRIAAAHGMSERCLAKLFEPEETTVSRWIWAQRLDEAHRNPEIASPNSTPRDTVATVDLVPGRLHPRNRFQESAFETLWLGRKYQPELLAQLLQEFAPPTKLAPAKRSVEEACAPIRCRLAGCVTPHYRLTR